MKKSELRDILLRLEAMIKDETSEIQERQFAVEGYESIQVSYDRRQDIFKVFDPTIQTELEFDNIDFAAMEILELTQPVISKDN